MFSRRLATFLLGIWLGCCALVDIMALEGHRVATRILDNPSPEALSMFKMGGDAPASVLLHHLAAEQTRANLQNWEVAQMVLALTILVTLVLTEQRKVLAIVMCAVMGILAVVQHFAVTPDLNILGRNADFLPEAAAFSVRSQMWTLTMMYGGMETLKLVIGGVLTSYFFAMESTVKRGRSRRTRSSDEALAPVK